MSVSVSEQLFCHRLLFLAVCMHIFSVHFRVTTSGLTKIPIDTNATEWSDVRFECSTNSKKNINWQFGRDLQQRVDVYISGEGLVRPYDSSKRHSVYENPSLGQYDLIIRNVTVADEGIYSCSEISSRGVPPQAKLTVISGLTMSTVQYRDEQVAILEGDVILSFVKCLSRPFYIEHLPVGNDHADDVYNTNRFLNGYATSGRFVLLENSEGFCQMQVHKVQVSDAGTFTCREHAGLGDRYNKGLIVVDSPPKCDTNLNSTDCLFKEKINMSLSCEVNFTGLREPSIQWSHEIHTGIESTTFALSGISTSLGRQVMSTVVIPKDNITTNSKFICSILDSTNSSKHFLECSSLYQCQDNNTTLSVGIVLGATIGLIVTGISIILLATFLIKRRTRNQEIFEIDSITGLREESQKQRLNEGRKL